MMPEALTKFWRQVKEFWSSLDKSQKNRLYITSSVVIVAIGISIFFMSRPNLITLIKSDDQKQISDMVTALNDNKIWNQLDESGTGIVINSRDKSSARVALSSKGLPKEGTTFADAISMIGISTTQDDKQHIWRQQQISEIVKNIKMIDNIYDASVNLAVPEQSIFISDGQNPAKPQAIVTVKSSQKLSAAQVHGIVLILTGSVENLDPKNVSVVDGSTGIPLSGNSSDDTISNVNNQEEMRVAREKDLRSKVLEQLGLGKSDSFDALTVTPNVVLDFDKESTQTKSLTIPNGMDGGALISSDTKNETVKNGNASGVPGQVSNPTTSTVPSYPTGSTGSGDYTDKEAKTNYGYDETVKNQEKATGKMIVGESSMAISLWYGKNVLDESKLTADFVNQIKLIANTATGIPIKNITVNKLKFAPDVVVKIPASDIIKQLISDYGFFALMLLLIIGMLIVAMPRKRQSAQVAIAAAGPRFLMPDQGEPIPEIDMGERSEIKKQIDKFVKQNPDSVAQLLRNWISDEWDG
jgi:flagellar M-ring protein FliF